MAVSFDLFGTLVAADGPADPVAAVAAELRARDVTVPDDWGVAYQEGHVDAPDGAEVSLPKHAAAALASRGIHAPDAAVHRAVAAAFDLDVRTRPGAREAVAAATERRPVGLLSNCSVPGLVPRTLARSGLDPARFDAAVTSVGCGWRKPDCRAFEAVADVLSVPVAALVHVGDDPATDGGADDAGATALILGDVSLSELPARLEESA